MSRELVNYSSDSSSADEEAVNGEPVLKVRIIEHKTKLPSAVLQLGEKKTSWNAEEDNPADHGGRIRTFQHERGTWATHIYIPVKIADIENIQKKCQEAVPPQFKLFIDKDLHISLSKTVKLAYHQILPFRGALKESFIDCKRYRIILRYLRAYTNEEKTRTFLAFAIPEFCCNRLSELLAKVNNVMTDFNQPTFYDDCSFHVSFLWCPGDELDLLKSHFHDFEAALSSLDISDIDVKVGKIVCKTGMKYFEFNLK